MVQNPQWPVLDESISFPTGPNTTPANGMWVSVMGRTEGATSTRRGRQYELDQVQAGESTLVLRNTDGAFDPDNTAGPYWPQVVPFRAHRRRAQYPPTPNLLLPSQATAGLAPDTVGGTVLGAGTVLPPWVAGTSLNFPTIIADTGSYNDYQLPYPASPGTTQMTITGFSAQPGQPYTAQCRARFTSGVAIQMQLAMQWIGVDGHTQVGLDAGTPVTLTGADQLLTVTSTPPANAAGGYIILRNTNSPASASTVAADRFQLEQASTASAYQQPSIWYPLITDYVTRWPQTWQDNGNYGVSSLQCADAFGYLSQQYLKSPAYMELLALDPTFFYPLDEDQDASLFYDLTTNRPPMSLTLFRGALASYFTPGNQLQSTGSSGGGYLPQGIGGPVVTFANPDVASVYGPIAALNLGATGQVGPPTGTSWTRIFAFRAPTTPTPSAAYLWAAISGRVGGDILLGLTGNTGQLFVEVAKNGVDMLGGGGQIFGPVVTDGGWHLVVLTMNFNGQIITAFVDGTMQTQRVTGSDMRPTLTGGVELLGGGYDSVDTFCGYAGDLAFVAELPFDLSSDQVSLLYSAFRFGGSGGGVASSGTRYTDILRWAGWAGAKAVDTWTTGETNAYGPGVDLLATAADQGTDVVTAGQNVVTTDNGNHYVAVDGTITFKARRARYNQNTPAVVFGENTAAGEIPYTAAGFDYDTTRLANDATVNQTATGVATRVYDQASITANGDVTMQRDVNTLSVNELFDAATFLVDRNRKPYQRLQAITIDVAANPTAWAALLALELGSRVRCMRRPPNAPVLQFDGFVEQINWDIAEGVRATCTLQLSSAVGLSPYELAGSTRMTLKNAVAAGVQLATVNPLPDAATNPIQANISGSDGFATWVIDWGTPNAEYVQINSVAPNAPGYTLATFGIGLCTDVATLASGTGFRHAHSVGALLQDIGGSALIYTLAQLTPAITPANALDAFATLGVSTILGY